MLDKETYSIEVFYDPALGRFLSPDPVVQAPDDTQSFNRYSYCLNNPLRYTDPTGLKWLMSKFGNEYFFFFDENVNDIMQLNTKYGSNSDIIILEDDIVVIIRDKETGETLNEFDLYPNGDFSIDGVNQTQEYNNNGLLHIGNTFFTDQEKISKNLHGSYLGSRNPKLTDGAYSYAVPPSDLHDYFAFQHDLDYDKVGAQGKWDALFNTNTLQYDIRLATNMFLNPFPKGQNTLWGPLTYIAFNWISLNKIWRTILSP